MGEGISEYTVVGYVDDLEEAMAAAERNGLPSIHKGLSSLHGDFIELGNMADSEEKIKRLQADVEEPLNELVSCCGAGDEAKSRGAMRVLRDKVHTLKAIWSR